MANFLDTKMHVVKWTCFHRGIDGKNRVVENRSVGGYLDKWIAQQHLRLERESLLSRGFVMHKENNDSMTLISCGQYVNIRIR